VQLVCHSSGAGGRTSIDSCRRRKSAIDQYLPSHSGQRHVESRGTRLNADFFCYEINAQLKRIAEILCQMYFMQISNNVMCYFRHGSRILQGRVSNPSERGTTPNYFDPCYRNQTIFLAVEEIVGARRSYTSSRAMSNPSLSSYSSCFVFTKHPVQLKTVTTCFQNMFFSIKGT